MRNFTGGKRQREADRDRRKKEKEERLRRNRSMRAHGDPTSDIATPEALPDVPLEEVVISVASKPRRQTTGPVKLFVGGRGWNTTTRELRAAFARFGTVA